MPKTIVQYINTIIYSCGHHVEVESSIKEDSQSTASYPCEACGKLAWNKAVDLGNSLVDEFLSDLPEKGRGAVEAFLEDMRYTAREEGRGDR